METRFRTFHFPSGEYHYDTILRQIYTGDWRFNLFHGQGCIEYPDGNRYIGGFKDHQFHGYGVNIYADGRRFSGIYVKGKREGIGVETSQNGAIFAGHYKSGRKHGVGVLRHENDVWSSVVYDKDQKITSKMLSPMDGALTQREIMTEMHVLLEKLEERDWNTLPEEESDEEDGTATSRQSLNVTILLLANQFGFNVKWEEQSFTIQTRACPESGGSIIQGDGLSCHHLAHYLPLLLEEVCRYCRQFFESIRLENLVLCRRLMCDGQKRAAVPLFGYDGRNSLYLHASVLDFHQSRRYLRHAFHHELFHVADFAYDGELYEDRVWNDLNSPGFRYGDGGIHLQQNPFVSVATEGSQKGLISQYAGGGIEEDKAELWANFMCNRDLVQERCRSDDIIRLKMYRLRQMAYGLCEEWAESEFSGMESWTHEGDDDDRCVEFQMTTNQRTAQNRLSNEAD